MADDPRHWPAPVDVIALAIERHGFTDEDEWVPEEPSPESFGTAEAVLAALTNSGWYFARIEAQVPR